MVLLCCLIDIGFGFSLVRLMDVDGLEYIGIACFTLDCIWLHDGFMLLVPLQIFWILA